MCREIMFRVWYPKDKRFIYLFLSKIMSNLFSFREIVCREKLTDWQQYTGTKDRNGKDIYEGDICLIETESAVENIGGYDRYESDNILGEIRFDNGCYYFTNNDDIYINFEDMLGEYGIENITVVDNIYQNPELLEK